MALKTACSSSLLRIWAQVGSCDFISIKYNLHSCTRKGLTLLTVKSSRAWAPRLSLRASAECMVTDALIRRFSNSIVSIKSVFLLKDHRKRDTIRIMKQGLLFKIISKANTKVADCNLYSPHLILIDIFKKEVIQKRHSQSRRRQLPC